MRALSSLLRASALFLPACAPRATLPPPAPTVSTPTPPPSGTSVAAPSKKGQPAEDLSGAPPSDLVAVGRLRSGDAALTSARQLAGDALPMLALVNPTQMLSTWLGDALAGMVDTSGSIDLALVGKGDDADYVVSMAVGSTDLLSRKLAAYKLSSPGKGRTRIDGAPVPCEVAPAKGPSPFRLVCSSKAERVGPVGAYLANTVAGERVLDELEVRMDFSSFLGRDEPKSKDPAEQFGHDLVYQVADAFRYMNAGVSVVDGNLRFSFGGTLRGAGTPVEKALLSQTRPGAPVPQLLAQLPADTTGAFYTRGATAEDLAPLRSQIKTALLDSMRADGLPTASIAAGGLLVTALVDSCVLSGGPVLMAYGSAGPAKPAHGAPGGGAAKLPAAAPNWTLFELDEPAARWTAATDQMLQIEKLTDSVSSAGATKSGTTTVMKSLPLTDRGLPKSGRHVILSEFERKDGKADTSKPASHTTHVYILPGQSPSPERTWIGISSDDSLVVGKLKGVLAGGSAKGGRTDLVALQSSTAGTVGFVLPRLLATDVGNAADTPAARSAATALTSSRAAAKPIMFTSAQSGDGPQKRVEITTSVPPALLTELLAAAVQSKSGSAE